MTDVASRWCVLLSNLSKLVGGEAASETDKQRPKPPMNQRDLAIDKPAHENLVRIGDRSEDRVDVMTSRVRPPAPLDVFADNRFRKARRSPFGRSEDDAVLSDESQRLLDSGALRHDAQRIKLIGAPRFRSPNRATIRRDRPPAGLTSKGLIAV